MTNDPRIARLITLIRAALSPPPGAGRVVLALGLGALCHALFAVAVLSMIAAMFFGMSQSFGAVPWPWAILANIALIVQFPLAHSILLTKRGNGVLKRLIPGPHGATLATTTYAVGSDFQPDGRNPTAHNPGILACRNVKALLEPSRPEKF